MLEMMVTKEGKEQNHHSCDTQQNQEDVREI